MSRPDVTLTTSDYKKPRPLDSRSGRVGLRLRQDGVLQVDPLAGRDLARRTSTYVVSGCVLAWRGVLGTHRLTPVGGNLGSSIR